MQIKISLKLIIIFLLSATFLSCTKKISTKGKMSTEIAKNPIFLESQVLIFQEGKYIDANLEMKPIPIQGKKEFYRDMYMDLRYPANARENNIQGTVMFAVDIDELGNVQKINRTISLSIECDKEAQSAIERGCRKGFEPYEYAGKTVKVRYLIPVNFRLR